MADRKPIELEEGWASMQVRELGRRRGLRRLNRASTVRRAMQGAATLRALVCFSRAPAPQQDGIGKLIRLLEGDEEQQFSAQQYMMLYT